MSLYKTLLKAVKDDLSGNLLNDLSDDVLFTWVDLDMGVEEAFLTGFEFGRNNSINVRDLKSEDLGDFVVFYKSEEEVIDWLKKNATVYGGG